MVRKNMHFGGFFFFIIFIKFPWKNNDLNSRQEGEPVSSEFQAGELPLPFEVACSGLQLQATRGSPTVYVFPAASHPREHGVGLQQLGRDLTTARAR